MIPKEFNLIWISNDIYREDNETPEWLTKVAKTYEVFNSKYKIKIWNNLQVRILLASSEEWIKKLVLDERTLLAQKTDIIRMLILKENGGIYVDTDTICIDSFDNILDNKFFVGQEEAQEDSHQSYLRASLPGFYINNTVIGSVKESKVIKKYFELLPDITNKLRISYGPNLIETSIYLSDEKDYTIIPSDYFFANNYFEPLSEKNLTKNSKIIHLYGGTSK